MSFEDIKKHVEQNNTEKGETKEHVEQNNNIKEKDKTNELDPKKPTNLEALIEEIEEREKDARHPRNSILKIHAGDEIKIAPMIDPEREGM